MRNAFNRVKRFGPVGGGSIPLEGIKQESRSPFEMSLSPEGRGRAINQVSPRRSYEHRNSGVRVFDSFGMDENEPLTVASEKFFRGSNAFSPDL